jgi:hypothetical protein
MPKEMILFIGRPWYHSPAIWIHGGTSDKAKMLESFSHTLLALLSLNVGSANWSITRELIREAESPGPRPTKSLGIPVYTKI